MIQISQRLVIPIEPYLIDTVNEVWLFLAIWAQYKRLYLYCGDYKSRTPRADEVTRRVCCWNEVSDNRR